MKPLSMVVFIVSFMVGSFAFAGEQSCTLAVENMSCVSCPYIIKQTLTKVPGVLDVQVSFENKTAEVVYDDAQTDVATLTQATTNVGFPSQRVK